MVVFRVMVVAAVMMVGEGMRGRKGGIQKGVEWVDVCVSWWWGVDFFVSIR